MCLGDLTNWTRLDMKLANELLKTELNEETAPGKHANLLQYKS